MAASTSTKRREWQPGAMGMWRAVGLSSAMVAICMAGCVAASFFQLAKTKTTKYWAVDILAYLRRIPMVAAWSMRMRTIEYEEGLDPAVAEGNCSLTFDV